MKKIYLSALAVVITASCFSQDGYIKRPALGFNFFFNDFQSAADLRKNGLVSLIKSRQFFKSSRLNEGVSIQYLEGLSKHVDFIGSVGGSSADYPIDNVINTSADNGFLLETTAALNIKLLSDKYWLTPFVDAGVGASKYKGYFAAFTPVGVGVQVNLFDEAYVLFNSQYRVPVTQNASYHFYHSVGIAGNIVKRKVEAPKAVALPVVEIKDRDNDGIVDSLDACPDIAGSAALQGCPDRDGDGIADNVDSCADVPGLAKYNGCPVPDTDKDGINDEEDKCPAVAGVARYQGCPVPDTDGDGVNDEEDKCPNEAGPASNFGCPEIRQEIIEKVNLAAKNIFFSTGSAKLLAKSYASLNNVVKVLTDNPTYKVDVEGHTDITGIAEKNQVLSENRAASVKAYLVSKGVDAARIEARGFGIDKPVADNKTAAGRAKNRRVELKLRNY